MSEPIGRLSGFTPTSAGLDRDTLLFEAGRASAPSRQGWMAAAAVLALTQTLTVLLYLAPTGPVAVPPRPAAERPHEEPETPPQTPYLLIHQPRYEDPSVPPAAVSGVEPDGPPLRAFGPLPDGQFD